MITVLKCKLFLKIPRLFSARFFVIAIACIILSVLIN